MLVFPYRRHHSCPATAAALIYSIYHRGFPSPVGLLLTPQIPRTSTAAYSPTAARLLFAGAALSYSIRICRAIASHPHHNQTICQSRFASIHGLTLLRFAGLTLLLLRPDPFTFTFTVLNQ